MYVCVCACVCVCVCSCAHTCPECQIHTVCQQSPPYGPLFWYIITYNPLTSSLDNLTCWHSVKLTGGHLLMFIEDLAPTIEMEWKMEWSVYWNGMECVLEWNGGMSKVSSCIEQMITV